MAMCALSNAPQMATEAGGGGDRAFFSAMIASSHDVVMLPFLKSSVPMSSVTYLEQRGRTQGVVREETFGGGLVNYS